jgi:hypothetical protein
MDEDVDYGGSHSEASDESTDLQRSSPVRKRVGRKMNLGDTRPLLLKAITVSLIVTIFSLPQIDLISLNSYNLSVGTILTAVFLFNLIIICLVTAAYDFAIHRMIPRAQVIAGGIIGALIVSTIQSFSWIHNLLVYPFTFVILAAVLLATFWIVRELTEPRAYKNIIFFVVVIVLIYLAVKYIPPLLGVIKNGVPSANVTVPNGLSGIGNDIKSGFGNLSSTNKT